MAEAAVTRAEQILADFDVMGARYDEHQFEVCDREAEAARKFFKSAQVASLARKQPSSELRRVLLCVVGC
eukprot:1785862-Rhodomonas_salina.1